MAIPKINSVEIDLNFMGISLRYVQDEFPNFMPTERNIQGEFQEFQLRFMQEKLIIPSTC